MVLKRISKEDYVITAWAERASGPGWSNFFYKVLVQNEKQEMRIEYIQPEEMDEHLMLLFSIACETHSTVLNAVVSLKHLHGPKRKKKEGIKDG